MVDGVSDPDSFTWRGAVLVWRHESWPAFENRNQKNRAFFARVAPVGRGWIGTLSLGGQGADLKVTGAERSTPEASLESALQAMRDTLERVFPTGESSPGKGA